MPDLSNLPERCQGCAKTAVPVIHDKCNFCLELEFDEVVLCDLNRSTQDPSRFECHAFKPLLKLASGKRILRGLSRERHITHLHRKTVLWEALSHSWHHVSADSLFP